MGRAVVDISTLDLFCGMKSINSEVLQPLQLLFGAMNQMRAALTGTLGLGQSAATPA